jgi:hypothetical protein
MTLSGANPDNVANQGFDYPTDSYAKIIDGLSAQPILDRSTG